MGAEAERQGQAKGVSTCVRFRAAGDTPAFAEGWLALLLTPFPAKALHVPACTLPLRTTKLAPSAATMPQVTSQKGLI